MDQLQCNLAEEIPLVNSIIGRKWKTFLFRCLKSLPADQCHPPSHLLLSVACVVDLYFNNRVKVV